MKMFQMLFFTLFLQIPSHFSHAMEVTSHEIRLNEIHQIINESKLFVLDNQGQEVAVNLVVAGQNQIGGFTFNLNI